MAIDHRENAIENTVNSTAPSSGHENKLFADAYKLMSNHTVETAAGAASASSFRGAASDLMASAMPLQPDVTIPITPASRAALADLIESGTPVWQRGAVLRDALGDVKERP